MTNLPFIKTPDDDLINLNRITHIEIRKSIVDSTYILWAFIDQAQIGKDTTQHAGWPIVAGDKEHCEAAQDQIEELLKERNHLHILEGKKSWTIEDTDDSEELENEEDSGTSIKSDIPPTWFRNLPMYEDDDDEDWRWD